MVTEKSDDIDLLWLASAVANSTFIEDFYDHSFNNKLYAGRRRFMTQYVERFPLPNPSLPISNAIISLAKQIYETVGTSEANGLFTQLDQLVWKAFGVPVKKVAR